jgi:hypothetical protein
MENESYELIKYIGFENQSDSGVYTQIQFYEQHTEDNGYLSTPVIVEERTGYTLNGKVLNLAEYGLQENAIITPIVDVCSGKTYVAEQKFLYSSSSDKLAYYVLTKNIDESKLEFSGIK